MCFYYSALYPAAFFFGTAILIVQYYVSYGRHVLSFRDYFPREIDVSNLFFPKKTDKFCLMRIWGYSPFVGSEVAQFSRKYFFSGAILAYAIISAYAWAGFPYDNLCPTGTFGAARVYNNVIYASEEIEGPQTIEVVDDQVVRHCKQNWKAFTGFGFPPVPGKQPEGAEWMNDSQETLTGIYGWTSLAFLVGFIVLFFGSGILKYFQSWFRGVYESKGQKQEIDFSSNTEVNLCRRNLAPSVYCE